MDEGLSIYTSFSKQLTWGEYYKLLKKLLYKLQMAGNSKRSVSARGEPELQKEKIITKAICMVLEGFHFDEVKDVVETMEANYQEDKNLRTMNSEGKMWNNDFSDLLQKQIETEKVEEKEIEEPEEEEKDEDDEEKAEDAED